MMYFPKLQMIEVMQWKCIYRIKKDSSDSGVVESESYKSCWAQTPLYSISVTDVSDEAYCDH